MNIEISKLKLRIDKKEFDLTVEEATKLREEIDRILGARPVAYYCPPVPCPVYVPQIIQPTPWYYQVTCGGLSNASQASNAVVHTCGNCQDIS